jgi:hypothetical protein
VTSVGAMARAPTRPTLAIPALEENASAAKPGTVVESGQQQGRREVERLQGAPFHSLRSRA